MTTTRRLLTGFGTLVAVLILIVLALSVWLHSLQAHVDRFTAVIEPTSAAAYEMEINVLSIGMATLRYLHTGEADARQRVADESAEFARYKANYDRVATLPRYKALGEQVAVLFADYQARAERLMSQKDRGEVASREDLKTFTVLRNRLDDILDNEIQVLSRGELEAANRSTQETLRAVLVAALVLLVAGLAVAVFTAVIVGRRIVRTEQTLRVTLASIGDAVLTTDASGRVTYLNPVARSLTGWTHEEAAGKPVATVFRIVNEQTRQPAGSPVEEVMRHGRVVGLANHTVLVAKDGTERAIDDSAAPIFDERGGLIGAVLIFRDVSEQRRANRALADSEARMRAMFQTAMDCIITSDDEGKIIEFNPACEQTFGYRAQEALGRDLAGLIIPPALRERHRQGMARYLATGESTILDRRLIMTAMRKDGREFPVELTVTRIPTGGKPMFTAYLRDLTEQRRTQQEQRESERRFRALVEQVKDYAIFMTDTEGRATTWNEGVLRVLGFEEAGFIGKDIVSTIFTPEDVQRGVAQAELDEAAATGTANDDRWMMRKDGTRFFAMGVTTGLRDDDGKLLGFMKVMRDQTERKEMEDALRQYAADMSEADRNKSEFLAMLAHELRNPLAPITNAVQILRLTGGQGPAAQNVLDTMQRQVAQMVRLIDDLLDVNRISQGKIELRTERIDLGSAINHAVEASRPICAAMAHELTVTLPPEPVYVSVDPARLSQVVGNLLNNACKFTARGGRVGVIAAREGEEAVVRVRDNGIGIAGDQLPRIFHMFTQVDSSLDRSQSGLGIGLTLVKKLVEMHGGTIAVHSAGIGQGSEFVVRLPIASDERPSRLARPRNDTTAMAPQRVLVVDDNADSAASLAALLELNGHEVRTAYDGLEAVEAAARFRPDVILLDIGLPKLNGYEAARRIREQQKDREPLLVALTGYGQEADRQRSVEAGFDHHLVKPIELGALQDVLASTATRT